MCLFYCGTPLSETELMIRDKSIIFKRSFSQTLDTMGRRLIGQYDVNSLGGFPGFKMRMTCATFHCARKYPLSRTALNIRVRYFIPVRGSSFIILPVMIS
jgi:hypothetical protein